jgi:hypothetical protein
MKPIFKSAQWASFFVVFLLLVIVAAFEFLPSVKEARGYVSEENFENFKLSCGILLSDRPWYGKINHWFFTWIILTPALVFSISPNVPSWLRGSRVILTVLVCYAMMNLAVGFQWDIRNAPFRGHSYPLGTENEYRIDCDNIADGFSLVFSLLLAWIPACIYTWICLYFWHFYHQKFSKEIPVSYKRDIVSRILYIGLKVYFAITMLFVMAMTVHKTGLIDAKSIGWIYYITLRPLFIPFEIFWY